jgi:peptidylprolyl isomerase
MDRRLIGLLVFGGALLVTVIVVIVARSGGDDTDSGESTTATTTPTESTTAEVPEKPKVEVPKGPPPTELEIEDLEEGDGDEAEAGDQISVHYVGVDYKTGKEFDSSYERGEPFALQLGSGQVIPGWDQGLEGMKEGGRRQLIIPPDLAYGKQGQPPDIGPNATLVFVIDLVSVE